MAHLFWSEALAKKFDHEPRPMRHILGDSNTPAVLRHDTAHDRQAESAPTLLGRIVR